MLAHSRNKNIHLPLCGCLFSRGMGTKKTDCFLSVCLRNPVCLGVSGRRHCDGFGAHSYLAFGMGHYAWRGVTHFYFPEAALAQGPGSLDSTYIAFLTVYGLYSVHIRYPVGARTALQYNDVFESCHACVSRVSILRASYSSYSRAPARRISLLAAHTM
jgi:hypothetical protein